MQYLKNVITRKKKKKEEEESKNQKLPKTFGDLIIDPPKPIITAKVMGIGKH